MNDKAKSMFKNLRYAITANFFVLGISIVLNLVVPKYLSIKGYSYWQLYLFYASYVGFFHFGWLDGIYLKIGGEQYEDLDKQSLGSQFWYLTVLELIISFCIIGYVLFYMPNGEKKEIIMLTAGILILTTWKTFFLYIFQSTNRIKEYAQLSKNDRYLYLFLLIIYLLVGGKNFIYLIIFDIFSRLLLVLWAFNKLKDMLLLKVEPLRDTFIEIKDNLKIGSNLMVSNIAGMLIIGFTRIFVERKWDIETFGKLSFTLSISNMFMTFISAVGVVMFPLLRRTDREKLPSLYLNLRNVFVPFTFFLLIFFNPVNVILGNWLPEYRTGLEFMGILFPMIVYEGRMSLLINTYLKTIREEKKIMIANIAALLFSLVSSIWGIFILNNLKVVVLSIIFSLMLRCIIAEELLSKKLYINTIKLNIEELFLSFVFIVSNVFYTRIFSLGLYLFFFLVYITYNFGNIRYSVIKLIKEIK